MIVGVGQVRVLVVRERGGNGNISLGNGNCWVECMLERVGVGTGASTRAAFDWIDECVIVCGVMCRR